jgi:hypothetical protein
MANRPPLGGVTLSQEYGLALRKWRDEKDARAKAQDEFSSLSAEEQQIIGQPLAPRSWWEYAVDPAGDGAPTDVNSDAPGRLDRSNQLNADALVLADWWSEGEAGWNGAAIRQYQLSAEPSEGYIKAFLDSPSRGINAMSERVFPDIYIRTSMADYVPNPFNIFMEPDGTRMDPSRTAGFWKRTGQTLGQGAVGYGLMVGAVFVGLKFAPQFVDFGMESLEKVIGGTAEIFQTTYRTIVPRGV